MNLELNRENQTLNLNNLIETGVTKQNNINIKFDQLLEDTGLLEDSEVYNVALSVFSKAIAMPDQPKKMDMLVRAHEILTKKSSYLPSVVSGMLSYIPGTQYNVDSKAIEASEMYFHAHFKEFISAKMQIIEKHSKFENEFNANFDRIEKIVSKYEASTEWNNLKIAMEKGNSEEISDKWSKVLSKVKEGLPSSFKSNVDVEALMFKQRSLASFITPKNPLEAKMLALLSTLPKESDFMEQEFGFLNGQGISQLDDFLTKYSSLEKSNLPEFGNTNAVSEQNIQNLVDLKTFLQPPCTELHLDGLFKKNDQMITMNNAEEEFLEMDSEDSNPAYSYEKVAENPFEFDNSPPSPKPKSLSLPTFTREAVELDYNNFIRGAAQPIQEGKVHPLALGNQNYLSGISPITPEQTKEYFKQLAKENVATIIQLSKPNFIPTKDKPLQLDRQTTVKLLDEDVHKLSDHHSVLYKRSTIEVNMEGQKRVFNVISLQDNNEVNSFLDDAAIPDVEEDFWNLIEGDVLLSENAPSEAKVSGTGNSIDNFSSDPLTLDLPKEHANKGSVAQPAFVGTYGRLSTDRLEVLSEEIHKAKRQESRCIVNDTPAQENSSALLMYYHLKNHSKDGFKPEETLREYKQFSPLLEDKNYFQNVMTQAYQRRVI